MKVNRTYSIDIKNIQLLEEHNCNCSSLIDSLLTDYFGNLTTTNTLETQQAVLTKKRKIITDEEQKLADKFKNRTSAIEAKKRKDVQVAKAKAWLDKQRARVTAKEISYEEYRKIIQQQT